LPRGNNNNTLYNSRRLCPFQTEINGRQSNYTLLYDVNIIAENRFISLRNTPYGTCLWHSSSTSRVVENAKLFRGRLVYASAFERELYTATMSWNDKPRTLRERNKYSCTNDICLSFFNTGGLESLRIINIYNRYVSSKTVVLEDSVEKKSRTAYSRDT